MRDTRKAGRRSAIKFSALSLLLLVGGWAASVSAVDTPVASSATPGAASTPLGKGYLGRADLPDSLLLLPPPPAPGSAALARDEEASRAGLALKDGPRWKLAASDADLLSPAATGAMSCAAGFEIGPKATPAIDRLMRRTLPDLGLASYGAKQRYNRARPFMINGAASCTPDHETYLRRDGSYPSGHSAIGYGWGLILAEIIPDRAGQLVARGRAFGDSRRVCNVHWLSDTEEGRIMGAAVLTRLHADPGFQADLQAAKAEVETARKTAPTRDCAAESVALSPPN